MDKKNFPRARVRDYQETLLYMGRSKNFEIRNS